MIQSTMSKTHVNAGLVQKSTDPNGLKIRYTYATFGQMLMNRATRRALGVGHRVRHPPCGAVLMGRCP